jgi:hypothetical protein
MYGPRKEADDPRMSDRQIHLIEEDLDDGAVEAWAAEGLRELDAYLAKHAAFLTFLDSNDG